MYNIAIGIVLFLILLSCMNMNNNMSFFTTFFIIFIIFNWIIKDIYLAFGISIILIIVLYTSQDDIYEGFEVDELIDELKSLNMKDIKGEIEDEEEEEEEEEEEFTEEELQLFDEDEEETTKKGDITANNKYMKKMTPARAQRETFRLIKTIEQLDDTVKNLAPTLKKGESIIRKFKKLNLVK